MKTVKINNNLIHNYCEPYIIAEIGANHNGDMDLAKKMILSAKQNGANCAKFQSWTPSSLVSREEYKKNQKYNDSKKKHFGSLKEMITKYALTDDQHKELKEFCDSNDIEFASSPFSYKEAKLLNDLEVSFFKIASMDINYHSFIRDVAAFKKPMILSTGMSTLSEIDTAVELCYKEGNSELILLHCISIYPPEYEDIHLNNISMLQQTFGLPVGFSDHTIGTSIPLASAALGACLIEKHFTLDKGLPGWDHEISADPEELKIISTGSKNIVQSLGNHKRTVSDAEESKKSKFRRSIVAKNAIPKGTVITKEHLDAKRPGTQIPPNEMEFVIGRTTTVDIPEDDLLKWDMF